MTEDFKKEVYDFLGLDYGSLLNEGGRDWNDAVSEILKSKKISYDIKKIDIDFSKIESIINDSSFCSYENKRIICINFKLTKEQIIKCISFNDKDILLAIIRNQEIDIAIASYIKNNNTYLVKKELEIIGYIY